jgi:drug/metabolite transporter (DMT)-like permease
MVEWWVGVLCCVVGNLLNSISFQLQRYAHVHNEQNASYLTLPLWWTGLLCMVLGETGNFVAYGIAPAALVAPMGAIAVVSNAVLSRIILKETGSYTNYAGVLCALAGTILIILNAPTKHGDAPIYNDIVSWQGLLFWLLVTKGVILIANPFDASYAISENYSNQHVLCYCAVCSLAGSVTVVSAKVVSTAFAQAIAGNGSSMLTDSNIAWLTYLLLCCMILSAINQVAYLNHALMHFGASTVVPVYFVMFTLLSVAVAMLLFKETVFTPQKAGLFATGLALACMGVYGATTTTSQPPDDTQQAFIQYDL